MADTKFTIDASQALAQLDGIERALGELEARFRALPASIRGAFQSTATGKIEADLRKAETAVEGVKRELDGVQPKVTAAFNPAQAEKYAKAVAGAEKATVDFNRANAGRRADPFGGAGGGLGEVNRQAGLGATLFRGLAGAAAGAAAAFSFGDAIVAGVQLNAEYERVKTSLTVLLKDAERADALLGKLNQFAAETPFQSDEINRAATSLLAFGESEQTVIDRLREIGTLSAGTGKDFNELTAIYGKARVAGVLYAEDINQLVEAGIPIIQEFAKQMGVSESQVKKLASEGKVGFEQLQAAFTNLTTGNGQFAGLLEAQSKTLGGQISTLKDNANQLLRVLTSYLGIPDALKTSFGPLSEIIGQFTRTLETGEAASGRFGAVINYFATGLKVITKQWQIFGEILRTVFELFIRPIAEFYFSNVIPAFQQAGDKVAEFVKKAQEIPIIGAIFRQLFAAVGAFKDLWESVPATFAGFRAAAQQAVTNVVQYFEGLVRSAKIVAKEIDLALSIKSDTKDRLREEIAELKRQEVKAKEAGKSVGQAYSEARNAALKDIKVEEAKQAKPEGVKVKQTGLAVQVGKSAAEIAFDNRAKDISRRRTLLNDLEDGLEKELEAVRLHFDQLRLEYDKAGLDTSKLAQKQATAEAGVFASALDKQVEADAAALEEIKRISETYIADQTAKAEQVKALRDREILEAQERANSIIAAAQSAGVAQSEITRLRVEADRELAERRTQAEQEYNKALADAKKATIEQQKRDRDAEIDLQEERGNQLVLIAQKAGAKEAEVNKLRVELDRANKEARLQSELEFQQALLAITDTADAEQVRSIQSRIELLQAQIGTLKLQGVEGVAGPKKKQTIYDLLGIDIETDEGQRAADAIKEMQGQVIEGLQSITAARTAAADAALAEADRLVQSKQDELDQEIALAEAGFASNVALKQQELEQAKKQWEKALDEQRKAQRAQILLDTAVQVSGLATSAANIFKSLSPLGPFGVAAAIASIGVMFAAFAKSKADALKATRARYGMSGFIDGRGIVHGKSHAQGGQHLEVERGELIQIGDDGSRRRLEVVRRERARQYFDLLRAANEGDQKAIARHAFSLAGIDPDRVSATDAQAVIRYNVPRVQQDSLNGRLESVTTNNTSTTIISQPDTRQAALLEAILYEMKRGRDGERWSADGKTRIKGTVRTTFVN